MRTSIIVCAIACTMPLIMHAANTSVNQSISVSADEEAGRVSSVNGNVRMDDNVRASSVSSVNGNIRIGAGAFAESVDNVNGNIAAGNALEVTGELSNVNGNIELGANTTIGGEISTVNGRVSCTSGRFERGLNTVNGDVTLGNVQVMGQVKTVWGDINLTGAQIAEGIRVIKPRTSGWNFSKPSPPKIMLGAGTVVKGQILLEHPAQIYAHQSVVLPAIEGQMVAPVIRFNGASAY